MSEEEMEKVKVWRRLSNNQRIYLMNCTVGKNRKVWAPHFIVAFRSLDRLGLSKHGDMETLAKWAEDRGYARQDGPPVRGDSFRRAEMVPSWTFSAPAPVRRHRIDLARLTEAASAGKTASAIAAEFGTTRQAVYAAAQRGGVTLPRPQTRPKAPRESRPPRPNRLVLMVSDDELARIRYAAAARPLRVSTYLREVINDALGNSGQQVRP